MVQEYKYLGCVVDEYLEYKSMHDRSKGKGRDEGTVCMATKM